MAAAAEKAPLTAGGGGAGGAVSADTDAATVLGAPLALGIYLKQIPVKLPPSN